MLRAEQLQRLLDHRLVDGDLRGLGFEELRGIRDHAQAHRHLAAGRGEVDVLRMATGVDRRVDQDVERHVLVIHRVAAATLLVQRGERGPAGRIGDARIEHDLACVVPGRVQHGGEELQVEHARGHHHAALAAAGRGQEVEFRGDLGHALRHVEVEGMHVQRVALPLQFAVARLEREPGDLVDRAARRMPTRHPRRIQQGQRPRLHRDGLPDLEDALVEVGGIDVEPDRARRIGHVARRGDRRCVLRMGAAGKQQGQGDGQQATMHRATPGRDVIVHPRTSLRDRACRKPCTRS